MAVDPSHLLTYEDFVSLPDDGIRREIIAGEVFVTPSPTVRHQRLALRLLMSFGIHLAKHGGGEVFVAPLDVLLSEHDIVEPDLIFVASDREHIITAPNLKGSPTLLIEVVSDPRTDRVRKRDLYARTLVPEYWIVDPEADRVEVYSLSPGGYGKPEIFEPGDTLTTTSLPGLEIDLTALFAR